MVLVLGGADLAEGGVELSVEELAQQVVDRAAAGEKLKVVAKDVAEGREVSSRELYDAALALRK